MSLFLEIKALDLITKCRKEFRREHNFCRYYNHFLFELMKYLIVIDKN